MYLRLVVLYMWLVGVKLRSRGMRSLMEEMALEPPASLHHPHNSQPTPPSPPKQAMATAWRSSADPLSQYLAAMTTTTESAAEEEEDDGAGHPDMHPEELALGLAPAEEEEEEDDETQPSPTPPHANDDWWPILRGRLARQGIVAPPHPTHHAPPPTPPPPAFLAIVQDLERFHTQLRATFRLLHGSLALRCGRGISVPMVPLMSLHPSVVEEEEKARVHAVVMPALRATLLQSLGRASRALVAAADVVGMDVGELDEGWRQGEKVIASLSFLLRQEEGQRQKEEKEEEEEEEQQQQQQQQQQQPAPTTTTRKGLNLLHLQTAFHAWSALMGECLPRLLLAAAVRRRHSHEDGKDIGEEEEEEKGQDATSGHLTQVLREEGICLVEAFGLRIAPSSPPSPPSSSPPSSTTITNTKESRHPLKFKARLQAIGHHLSLRRAAFEARLARVFLQQCALVDVLRIMENEEEEEGGEEGEEEGGALFGGLERLYEALAEERRERGEGGREGGLDEEGDVRAMLQALVKEGGGEGGGEGWNASGSVRARVEACVVVEGGGGEREAAEESMLSRREEKREYATIEKEEKEGEKEGGREEEEEDDPVLEVFEGRSGAEAQPDRDTRQQQQQHNSRAKAVVAAAVMEHDALMGELGRVLSHRQQQRPAATRVRVNGQVLMASSLSSFLLLENEEEEEGRREEEEGGGRRKGGRTNTLSQDGGAGEVSCVMGAALLAAVLQQQQQRGQDMEKGGRDLDGVEVFDGQGEGEDKLEGEEDCADSNVQIGL